MAILQKSTYKQLKKRVLDETAVGVGYFEGITAVIPSYALIEATRQLHDQISDLSRYSDGEIENILVTESIRALNFQDFKAVAPYLFSYPREAREADRLARPIEVSREDFETLQSQARELFQLKSELEETKSLSDIVASIEQTEVRVPSGYNVIGVNPLTDEYMIGKSNSEVYPSHLDEGFLDHDYLINDYRHHLSDEAQIINHLITTYPRTETYIYEYFNDLYYQATGILEGSQLVERYFEDEGLVFVPQETTANLYYLAQESEAFKEDYPTYHDFLLESVSHDYIFDQAVYFLESDEYMTLVNQALEKDGVKLVTETVNGYSQGDVWLLGAIYPVAEATEQDVRDFLRHGVGASYKGTLMEVFISPGDDITSLGLEEAKANAQNYYVLDEELLWGNKPIEVLQEKLKVTNFMSLEEAETLVEEVKQSQEEKGLGR
ncbi:hypothetical protein [Streptococcus canis]|uniref:Uncharacterized protein n=1 Tax=Streptococcus canis FSL Z3-227 TaxID=482234 RepID=A0AAV3FUF3_STRCB|nr:hypothetical protein [Streptococcus canis]EIQ82675.1 hypothetical protein SCAZ3_09950 [Streptococcus canis FSL Z3-227]